MALFLALACVLAPYAGIQYDEALFATPIYSEVAHEMKMRAFHHDVPLMLMTYLGTAKTWLYSLIFSLWHPTVVSLRLPVILIGAVTIGVLFDVLRRAAGMLIAIAATLLLATDASYILTTTFDWGPVAIQHLAWIGGVLLVFTGYRSASAVRMGAGFFLFGLAMWDKAIFLWMLSGTGVAALALFHRQIRQSLTVRNVAAAIVGFGIGATPLIIYNIRNPLRTFQGNAVFSTEQMAEKLVVARTTLSGGSLFGYLVNEEAPQGARQAVGFLQRVSTVVRDHVGVQRYDLLDFALLAAVLAVPLWWPNRTLVFFVLIVMAVAWPQMLFTKNAGGGAHHVVLMWPLPHIVIATSLSGLARRWGRMGLTAASTVLAILCLSNVLVVNQYLAQFIRFGPTDIWSDAVQPLSDALTPYEDRPVFFAEWGVETSLRMLHEGRIARLWNVDEGSLDTALKLPGSIFISRVPPHEIQPGTSARLFARAERSGYARQLLSVIADSHGRPIFELSEFRPR